jgi:hypothetical protein
VRSLIGMITQMYDVGAAIARVIRAHLTRPSPVTYCNRRHTVSDSFIGHVLPVHGGVAAINRITCSKCHLIRVCVVEGGRCCACRLRRITRSVMFVVTS